MTRPNSPLNDVGIYTGDFPVAPVVGTICYRADMDALFTFNGSGWVQTKVERGSWHLFLDDERSPDAAGWDDALNVQVARSSEEAKMMVEERGLPVGISFDHDLGGDDTGFKFMWWLINGHLDQKWDLAMVKAVQVHSANPEGARKLMALWDNFCRVHSIDTTIKRVWPGAPSE